MKLKTAPDGIGDMVKARVATGGNQQDKSIYTPDKNHIPNCIDCCSTSHPGHSCHYACFDLVHDSAGCRLLFHEA